MSLVSCRGALRVALLSLPFVALFATAASAAAPNVVTDPPELKATTIAPVPRLGGRPRALPAKKAVAGHKAQLAAVVATPAELPGEKRFDLHVTYIDSKIYNPNTSTPDNPVYDDVRLRGYAGIDVGGLGAGDPQTPYIAPTIDVSPGDTVRITLHNDLPPNVQCWKIEDWRHTPRCMVPDPSCATLDMDKPHCFNGTNLHSHGLWVSPAGNSDNVLLSIKPGMTFQYEYNIPADHPAGTFWYHPHEHGSTALQVSSGMVGALIVHGNRLPTTTTHGDIDTLLQGPQMKERVLVLQQIQYGCMDDKGNIKVKMGPDPNDPNKQVVVAWICDPGDVGGIETYGDANGNGFGPGSWGASARYTSINGRVLPTFDATLGDVERWRMIHAGVRDTIMPQFYHMDAEAARSVALVTAAEESEFIAKNCTGAPIPYYLIAADGLTMAEARKTTEATLQPGYRSDALVVFPAVGDYCVVNGAVAGPSSVSRAAVTPRLLGEVHVTGNAPVGDIGNYLIDKLVAAANANMPADMKAAVVADLRNDLKFSNFTPHPDIADSEVTGKQYLSFFIDTSATPTKFEVSSDPFDKRFNPKPYDPDRIDRHLTLGSVDEWHMQSRFVSHPFHIHVNPLQIVAILDPNGKDVSAPDAVDDYGTKPGQPPDPQYPGLKGVWKDTIWIKNTLADPGAYPEGAYTIIARTRYERYIGQFVLHCHILDHEDQGMMQNVSIDLQDPMDSMNH